MASLHFAGWRPRSVCGADARLPAFFGQPALTAPARIDFVQPLTPADQKPSLEFFHIPNFALPFRPTVSSEQELMTRIVKIGIGAGKKSDAAKLSPEVKQASKAETTGKGDKHGN